MHSFQAQALADGRGIKAATFSANKWGWTAAQDPGLFVLRTSVGRYGEEEWLHRDDGDLAALSRRDLADAVGLTAAPVDTVVTRWEGGLPRYAVGHVDRVERITEAVASLPGLALAGATYGGVGVAACIARASEAGAWIARRLDSGGQWRHG